MIIEGFATQYIEDHHMSLWESPLKPTSRLEWQKVLKATQIIYNNL